MKPFYWFARSLFKVYYKLFHGLKEYGLTHIPEGPGILAANHTSYFDPPLISASFPDEATFLAKDDLFVNPFFRFLIQHLNAYPVADDGTKNLNSFKMVMKFLEEGKKVMIFPEGLRSPDGTIQPLKTGVAMIALRARCPVIPVYIHGTFQAWPKAQKYPKLGVKLACIFGSAIYPQDFEHLDKKQAQEEMTKVLSDKIHALKEWYYNGAIGTPP